MQDKTKHFGGCYREQTVLVFGNTGFKGSWLSLWLHELGAKVIGAADGVPTNPSHYEALALHGLFDSHTLDIRDKGAVTELIKRTRPDYVFHLAAQSLVKRSYRKPVETFEVNAMGTINILEALRQLTDPCVAVLITSDKCYENVETFYGYRETDRLGGKDPYSASKAAAEVAIRSYVQSFFSPPDVRVRIATTRAGNVIGGGDWAEDRLIPDIIRAWSEQRPVTIRKPMSTRPWQHVLEPLSGYLALGRALTGSAELHGESFNFGPKPEDTYAVSQVVECLKQPLESLQVNVGGGDSQSQYEAGLLKLSCDKALHALNWRPVLEFTEAMSMTANWYHDYYRKQSDDILNLSLAQLQHYCDLAQQRGHSWATAD